MDNKSIISELENEIDITNNKKTTSKNNNYLTNQNQKMNDTVNINNIDPNKIYEECNTALEFFILSLFHY